MALYPLSDLPAGNYRTPPIRGGPTPGLAQGDDWFAGQGPPPMAAGAAPGGGGGAQPGWVTEEGLPARPPDLETAFRQANQIAYGGRGGGDINYWREMWQKDPGYAWKRMLGWQAGGKDVATSGPFAGGAGGVGGGGGAGGGFGAGGFGDPSQMMASLEQSPGFQFRLGEGLKALEKSAAARGTLLTGGTAKGLERYAQDYASNEYQNRYNQLLGLGQLGLNAAGQQGALGSQYAGQAGGLLAGQAGAIGDWLTGAGNARAAGTVGGANAWQQGLSGASNNAMQMLLLSQLMRPGGGGGGSFPYLPGQVLPPR